jgi:sugar phosphate isomerase/epimerase
MSSRRSTQATQYTIRNVPKVVDRALRRRADRMARSLNEVAVEALARGAGVEQEAAEHHDVDFLFGSWVEDPITERALADQRTIDESLWK